MSEFGPPAEGERVAWSDVPEAVRAQVEETLGSRVVCAETCRPGFSPGVAARLTLANGESVFFKLASDAHNPLAPSIHRREIEVLRSLPPSPLLPEMRATLENGEWVGLVLDWIDGRMPAIPWRPTELAAVLAGITELSELLSPCPIDAEPFEFEPQLAALSGSRVDHLDPWLRRNLDAVAQLEALCNEAAQGDALIHCDLRADNILLTTTGVRFLDWPWACRGAAWVDLVGLLLSAAMQGGPPPDELLTTHPLARGVDPEAIDAAVAGLIGIFVCSSLQPDPPGLPTLRCFQAAQGVEAVAWLRQRTGWP